MYLLSIHVLKITSADWELGIQRSNGVNASCSTAVVIEESTFTGGGANPGLTNRTSGIQFNNGCTNCRVSNCQFAPVDVGIFAQQIDGLIIDKQ